MSHQQQQRELKVGAGYFISAFLLGTGVVGLASPATLAYLFGMPIQSGTYAASFVQCFGSRNLTLGILNTIFLQRGNLQAAGTLAGLLAIDGGLDAIITYNQAGALWAAPHVLGAAVIPFVSRWMMS
jgi:hypothetical protein